LISDGTVAITYGNRCSWTAGVAWTLLQVCLGQGYQCRILFALSTGKGFPAFAIVSVDAGGAQGVQRSPVL
jgi:hypothetical protein